MIVLVIIELVTAGYLPRPGEVWWAVSKMAHPSPPSKYVFTPLCSPFLLSVGWTYSLASNE